jgi:hypothetical protein
MWLDYPEGTRRVSGGDKARLGRDLLVLLAEGFLGEQEWMLFSLVSGG